MKTNFKAVPSYGIKATKFIGSAILIVAKIKDMYQKTCRYNVNLTKTCLINKIYTVNRKNQIAQNNRSVKRNQMH